MQRKTIRTLLRRFEIFAALLALGIAAAPGAFAQGSRKDDIVIGPRGTPLGGASVAICTQPAVITTAPCSPLATLYSNSALTQALANPLTTDGLGNYSFYAAPGKYTVQVYGPGLTTRTLTDVILPSDPSAPTFSSVTTTSGITAFSLALSGNLTVSGNSAVTGTLTVGGAPVPSTGQDLQWSSSQRFKGPIPFRDITAYGPPGGCPQVYYMPEQSGTIASGSKTLTFTDTAYNATNGCGVVVYGAGPNSSLSAPGTITAAPYPSGYTGSTTRCYEVAAVDNNLGMSATSAHTCITNGVATLGRDSYNFLSWATVTNAVAYVIYESASSGGTYTAIGTSYTNAYCDMGFSTAPVPDFAPTTAPSAVTAQALFTTIASGGNGYASSSLTLAAAASNSVSGSPFYQDDSWMLAAALAATSVSTDGGGTILVIPPGMFWFAHLPNLYSAKIEQRGEVNLWALPLITYAHWIGYGGTGDLAGGSGQYAPIGVSSHVGAVFVTNGMDLENIAAANLYGDGIEVGSQGGGGRYENISLAEVSNGAGSPIRLDADVIILYGKNWTLQGATTTGGAPCIWFNAETSQAQDSIIRVTQLFMAHHSIKFDAPVAGGLLNPHNAITFDKALTEGNIDHGFVVVEGAPLGNIELNDISQDNNYSNYIPDILEIGPSATAVGVIGVAQVGAAPYSDSPGPGTYSGWRNSFDPGVNGVNYQGYGGASGGGTFTPLAPAATASGVSSVGALISDNLAVMDGGQSGDVQWGQLVVGFSMGQLGLVPQTGTGSLPAGTYYYRLTCINPDNGETIASTELSATLSATGRIEVTVSGPRIAGCLALRAYRGTTSGGENLWLTATGQNYTQLPVPYNSGFYDDGSWSTTSATPPSSSNAFLSKMKMDPGSFSYLLADGQSGSLGTRLGIGTMIDPGSSSGIKLDIAGGTVRGQSGIVAGLSDPAFTNSPRAIYHAFVPALTSTATASTLTLDKGITVTRVQAQAITAPSGCTTNAVVRVSDGTSPLNVTVSAAANDSGAVTQNYAAGALLTISVSTAAAGCTTSPANVNVEVQYRMQ
ncbi:MAG: hypothetical protein ACLP1Y_12025 [Candidatus Acidiferrales bacterium]